MVPDPEAFVSRDLCQGVLSAVDRDGEVRPIGYVEERLREADNQVFRRALVPSANAPRRAIDGIVGFEVVGFERLEAALDLAF